MKQKTKAILWTTNHWDLESAKKGSAGIRQLTFMPEDTNLSGLEDWVKVGTAEVTVNLMSEQEIIRSQIESLEASARKLKADAEAKCTFIQGQIQSLLAIGHEN